MEKLTDIEQYKTIVREERKKHKKPFSNIYLMPKDLENCIEQKRAYFEIQDGGFLLIIDEQTYYKLCVSIDPYMKFSVPDMDKKVVFEHVFRKEKSEECPVTVENELKGQQFCKKGTIVQVCGNTEIIYENCKKSEDFIKRLEREGFSYIALDSTYYARVRKMLLSTNIITDYQINHVEADSEKRIFGGILDKESNLCAVSMCTLSGLTAYGQGIMIEDKYRLQGLAPMLSYYGLKRLLELGIEQSVGWIETNNRASLRYHHALGYELINKYTDEWIRQ